MENSSEEKLPKNVRTVWMVLVVIFGALALFNLYRWTQGKDALSGVMSQTGMVLVGLATLIGSRHKSLSVVFLILGGIALIAGLVMVVINLSN